MFLITECPIELTDEGIVVVSYLGNCMDSLDIPISDLSLTTDEVHHDA